MKLLLASGAAAAAVLALGVSVAPAPAAADGMPRVRGQHAQPQPARAHRGPVARRSGHSVGAGAPAMSHGSPYDDGRAYDEGDADQAYGEEAQDEGDEAYDDERYADGDDRDDNGGYDHQGEDDGEAMGEGRRYVREDVRVHERDSGWVEDGAGSTTVYRGAAHPYRYGQDLGYGYSRDYYGDQARGAGGYVGGYSEHRGDRYGSGYTGGYQHQGREAWSESDGREHRGGSATFAREGGYEGERHASGYQSPHPYSYGYGAQGGYHGLSQSGGYGHGGNGCHARPYMNGHERSCGWSSSSVQVLPGTTGSGGVGYGLDGGGWSGGGGGFFFGGSSSASASASAFARSNAYSFGGGRRGGGHGGGRGGCGGGCGGGGH